MFGLVKHKPTYGFWNMRDYFDSFFKEKLPVSYEEWKLPLVKTPVIDIIDKTDHLLVKAEVPGFKKEELSISVEGDILTLCGETRLEKEEKKENYYYKESGYGSFSRSVRLSTEVKKEEIKAWLKDGILSIELPKVEAKVPKMIEIETK